MPFLIVVTDPAIARGRLTQWAAAPSGLRFAHPLDIEITIAWLKQEQASEVLVLARPGTARSAHRLATTIAGALPSVAVHPVFREASLLTMAVAASSGLERDEAPSQASATVVGVLDASVGGAHLHRLTKLDSPRPSMWQHITALFGRRHVAFMGSPGSVSRADRPIDLPENSTLLVAAEERSVGYDAVVAALHPRGATHVVPPVLETAATFGTHGTEFVAAVIPDGPPLSRACGVCTHPTSTRICPFCRITTSPQELRA